MSGVHIWKGAEANLNIKAIIIKDFSIDNMFVDKACKSQVPFIIKHKAEPNKNSPEDKELKTKYFNAASTFCSSFRFLAIKINRDKL